MKKLISIFHWLLPFSLLVLLFLSMVWVQNLSVPETDHEWMLIGLIGIFFLLINVWISKNPSEFMAKDDFDQTKIEIVKKGKNEEHH